MKGREFVERIRRARQKWGLIALPKKIGARVRRTARDKWRAVFNDRNCVFVYDGEPPQVLIPGGIAIRCYRAIEDVPEEVVIKMTDELGSQTVSWLNQEFSEKGELWLLFVEGEFAVRQFVRRGRYFDKWFIPLADEDFVILAVGTFPEYQGRGLYPLLARYAMAQEMRSGGRAFVDCKVWNESAISAVEKIGFRNLGTIKNYWEGDRITDRISAAFKKIM